MTQKELHEIVETKETNICQIVAYKDGKEVYSDTWNGYQENDACHVMSVTKSVVALLIGIAVDHGLIKSVDQPVLDFFPEYRIKRGEKTIQKVTIRHLLTMTAPYKYKSEPWTKVCTSDDWTVAALDLLGGRAGITGQFRYSTLGVHILTGILAKVSGKKTVEFANEYLFKPLGIFQHENYFAKTAEEHKKFTLSKEPRKHVWFCDPQGVGTAGYGLCFSAKDMAKIGQLCLQSGRHNGRQVVSETWIKEITTPYQNCGKMYGGMCYGYLWWIPFEGEKTFAAVGDGGNVIYVHPEKNIVIAVAATFKARVFDRVDFIRNYIETYAGTVQAESE